MSDVVALELEARAVRAAQAENLGDVRERVLEHPGFTRHEILRLPFVLPRLLSRQHLVEPEVHRAHVERRELGLQLQRWLETMLDGHRLRSAGRDVDDDVAGGRDPWQELSKQIGILRGPAVAWIAGVQVDDGRAGAGG